MRSVAVAEELRSRVQDGGHRFWEAADFDDLGDPSAIWQALHRLAADGALRRVHNGLYWRGPTTAAFPALGMSAPSGEALARQLAGVDGGYGRAGASAINALGLSSQVPREDCWAIPRRPPAKVPAGLRFVSRPARLARVAYRLNPIEVAVLEALDSSAQHWIEVDDDEVDLRILRLARAGSIDRERLLAGAANEERSVRERLGSVFVGAA